MIFEIKNLNNSIGYHDRYQGQKWDRLERKILGSGSLPPLGSFE